MPVLMTTVAETNKIDCFLMGDSSSLALQGETPRELVQFRRGSFGWGREACDHMPLMDRKRELRQRWQRAAQLSRRRSTATSGGPRSIPRST
jgi:hypothetical protein